MDNWQVTIAGSKSQFCDTLGGEAIELRKQLEISSRYYKRKCSDDNKDRGRVNKITKRKPFDSFFKKYEHRGQDDIASK